MKKLIQCSFAALLFSSQLLHAGDYINVYGKVLTVYERGELGVLIKLKDKTWPVSGDEALDKCTAYSLVNDMAGVTEDIKDRIFSVMLSAYMADKKIGLTADTTSNCYIQQIKVGDSF